VRAYVQSTSKFAATEQNKSAVRDHAISLNHITDWDRAKVIDRESNRMDRWIREANNTSRWTEMRARGLNNFHTFMITYCPPQWHLVDSCFEKGSSGCRNINNFSIKSCSLNLHNLLSYYFNLWVFLKSFIAFCFSCCILWVIQLSVCCDVLEACM